MTAHLESLKCLAGTFARPEKEGQNFRRSHFNHPPRGSGSNTVAEAAGPTTGTETRTDDSSCTTEPTGEKKISRGKRTDRARILCLSSVFPGFCIMSNSPKHPSYSRFTRGNTLLSVVSCEPTETRGDRTHCYRVSKARPATSRLLTVFHVQLGKDTQDQWVLGRSMGVHDTLLTTAIPAMSSTTPAPLLRGGSTAAGRDRKHARKTRDRDNHAQGRGFLSTLFLVPKDGGQRPVINLKSLNKFVHTEHFKMEGIHVLRDMLRAGD